MTKASGGDGIPVELFQILIDDAVKMLHSICQQIWKTQQWPQDWKKSVFIPIPKKGDAKRMFKLPHSCIHLKHQQSNAQNSASQASKVCEPQNFQMFKLDLEKAEEPEIKLPKSIGSSKKQENSRKASISALLTMPKPLCVSQLTVENSQRDGNTKPPDLSPEKSVCRSRNNSQNWTWNRQIPNWERSTSRLYIVTLFI